MGMHATAWIACQENEHLGEIYMEIERINWVVKSKKRVILIRVLDGLFSGDQVPQC